MSLAIVVLPLAGGGNPNHSPVNSGAALAEHTLRRGIGGEPGSLNPLNAGDSFSYEILGDLYEGLTAESPDGSVVPGVAASWSTDPTGLIYTFNLRAGAKWSNGAPLRSSDFVNAWRRVVDPKAGSPNADNLRLIAGARDIIAGRAPATTLGVTAPSDDRLIVTLEKPAPYFPELLAHPSTFPVYSLTAAASHGGASWVSNGPYALSSWTPGGDVRLVKNAAYWGRTQVSIEAVVYEPVPDENAELRRYRAGQLDVTQSVPAAALPAIRRDHPAELHVAPFLATAYYAFNLHADPFKSNLALRRALTMAIDRQTLLKTILPLGQQAAYGFVPPGTLNYEPQSWDWQNLSDGDRRTEAKHQFAKAGFGDRLPSLHLRLLFNSGANIKQIAIAVAAMWKEVLGIDTELIEEEYRVFLESRNNATRWDVVRLGWTADYNDASNFLNTLRTGSPNDDAGYSNAQFDALLDQAAETDNANQRKALLKRSEALMLSDYAIVPLYFFTSKRLFKSYVHGEVSNPLNRLYSKFLTLDALQSTDNERDL